MNKKLTVTHKDGDHKDIHAVSIDQALRDLAKDIKRGHVEVPCTIEFDGPNGLRFTVTVADAEQAGVISTLGFKF